MAGRGRDDPHAPAGALLSIGALSRATGVGVETLRTWERRYGFPVPERKPSGHRVYSVESVPRLRRIAAAVAQGHRAGDAVRASDEHLSKLLGVLAAAPPAPAMVPSGALDPHTLLALVERFDGDGLTRVLASEWGRLGPMAFLQHRVAPLVEAVGFAWETGTLEVRHEHFLSERVGDLLRAYRLPFDDRAHGPAVVLATLPGESHAIGLQMAALVIAMHGCRVCYVGTEVPLRELASVAADVDAGAVGLGVSIATRGARTAKAIAKVRRLVAKRTRLILGGAGAPAGVPGTAVVGDLANLAQWATTLGRAA
jgi:MerR family transcriptional regulator, light-induced transcriptional regulator